MNRLPLPIYGNETNKRLQCPRPQRTNSAHIVVENDVKDSVGSLPAHNGLDPNPKGRPNSDKGSGCNRSTRTKLYICIYNVSTLRIEESLEALLKKVSTGTWFRPCRTQMAKKQNQIKLWFHFIQLTSLQKTSTWSGIPHQQNHSKQYCEV